MAWLKGGCRGIRVIEDSNRLCVNCKEKIIILKQPTIRYWGNIQHHVSQVSLLRYFMQSLQKDTYFLQFKYKNTFPELTDTSFEQCLLSLFFVAVVFCLLKSFLFPFS